jgi:hypothetical protein
MGRTRRKSVTAAKSTGPDWVADDGQARRLGITRSSLREPSCVDDLVADHDQLAILALRDPSQIREGLVGIDAEFLIKIPSACPMIVRLDMAMPRPRISRYAASATEICAAKA